MDQIVQPISSESLSIETKNSVEIVVHIKETLEEEQRDSLVSALENTEGIIAAEFCPLRYHLMLVSYNKDLLSSLGVLNSVKSQNIHAQLIGPV